ncbi:hypothetical protein T4D_7521 [Trichinella pseudospiralis]|uniref:Uncharacterized protein n=1 Tax=Trichinella pseudospiralis TaxID=6337 RepID=A0A0V1DPN0_TRIPS|nr:hypothetical protein T4D_7521 [Trichinella pseudospiralis]
MALTLAIQPYKARQKIRPSHNQFGYGCGLTGP